MPKSLKGTETRPSATKAALLPDPAPPSPHARGQQESPGPGADREGDAGGRRARGRREGHGLRPGPPPRRCPAPGRQPRRLPAPALLRNATASPPGAPACRAVRGPLGPPPHSQEQKRNRLQAGTEERKPRLSTWGSLFGGQAAVGRSTFGGSLQGQLLLPPPSYTQGASGLLSVTSHCSSFVCKKHLLCAPWSGGGT